MINLFKSDVYRILRGRVSMFSLLGIIILSIVLGSASESGKNIDSLIGIFSIGTMVLPLFFTSIYMATFGNEFSYRVINNSLVSGVKRSTYYLGKVILTFLMTTVFVLVFFSVLTLALKIRTNTLYINEFLRVLVAQVPLYIGVSSIGILCYNLIKTPYIANVVFVSIAFIGDNLLNSIIGTFLPRLEFLSDTFIFSNLNNVVVVAIADNKISGSIFVSCIIYSFILVLSGYFLIQRRELK